MIGKPTDQPDLDARYADRFQDAPYRPVFVMGDHRSGTTILYKILGATGRFNIVTLYHVLCFKRIVADFLNNQTAESKDSLNALFRELALKDRGFDRMSLDADTPEEYGFILRDGGMRNKLGPGNVEDLIALCKKIAFSSGNQHPILLKNPWDYAENFMVVKEMFPRSKFVFVHRHPTQVIDSQIRSTRSLMAEKNEYVALVAPWYEALYHSPVRLAATRFSVSSHLGLGLRITSRHVTRAARYFVDNIDQLPPEDYVSVRYEDLCADPSATVARIMQSVGISEYADLDYERYISARNLPLLDEVSHAWPKISRQMQPYLRYCGYEA